MEEAAVSEKKDLLFFSFMQVSRNCQQLNDNQESTKSSSYTLNKDSVVVISDDDAEPESDYELLCEVEFNSGRPLPLPFDQKITCKAEPESIQESSINVNNTSNIMEDFSSYSLDQEHGNVCSDGDRLMATIMTTTSNYINYVCPQCGIAFARQNTWQEHISVAHNLNDQRTFNITHYPNNEFECNSCHAILTRCSQNILQRHCFTHLPFKIYMCSVCRHGEHSLYVMISHIMLHKDSEELHGVTPGTHHTQHSATLEIESKSFLTYVCPACGIDFDEEAKWQAHINFSHNFLEKTAENRYEDHFRCSECGIEIFSQHVSDLQKHIFSHLPYKSFLKCKICNWTNSSRNFMTSHILNLHNSHLTASDAIERNPKDKTIALSRVFLYELDNEISKTPPEEESTTRMRTRYAVNTSANESLIENNTSKDKSYLNKSNYKKQGFRCTGCDRLFATAALRNTHNIAEHAKYRCKFCGKRFAIKADLKKHKCSLSDDEHKQSTSAGELSNCELTMYKCKFCSREYNYMRSYLKHGQRCRKRKTTVEEM